MKLGFKSLFEKLWNMRPTLNHFTVFGCVCYVFVLDQLSTKAVKHVFVGYDSRRKGWKYCDLMTEKCYVLRNVVFEEASFWLPFEKMEIETSRKTRKRCIV